MRVDNSLNLYKLVYTGVLMGVTDYIATRLYIPAGSVKGSVPIIISDIRITVSFSHQISHHIQMTLSAAKYTQ